MTNMSKKEQEEKKTPKENEEEETSDKKQEKEDSQKTDDQTEEKSEREKKLEAKLEEEREKADKLEKKLAGEEYKKREAKREDEDKQDVVTKDELNETLKRERQEISKTLNSEKIETMAYNLASSDTEAKLIIQIHQNRNFPEGSSLSQQVREAHAIANSDKLVAENQELKRSLKGKKNVGKQPSSSQQDSAPHKDNKMTGQDAEALKQVGYEYNSTTGKYEKDTARGKIVYDPETKKTSRVEK